MKLVKKYSIDNSCIKCGEGRGGHYFEGTRNDAGYYEVDGWLAIEHLAGCYVWLCPECRIDTLKSKIKILDDIIENTEETMWAILGLFRIKEEK